MLRSAQGGPNPTLDQGINIDQFTSLTAGTRAVSAPLKPSEIPDLNEQVLRLLHKGVSPSDLIAGFTEQLGCSTREFTAVIRPAARTCPEAYAEAIFSLLAISDALDRRLPRELKQLLGTAANEVVKQVISLQLNSMRESTSCIWDDGTFSAPNIRSEIIAQMPEGTGRAARKPPQDLPPYLRELYRTTLLTADQEQYLFRKYNFIKFELQTALNSMPEVPTWNKLARPNELLRQADSTRNFIAESNLRLVVAVAKSFGFSGEAFFDRISSGNIGLLKAIDKFDFTRGNKFSTYASYAIRSEMIGAFNRTQTLNTRFVRLPDDHPYKANASTPTEVDEVSERESNISLLKKLIPTLLSRLDVREYTIVRHRFGLDAAPETLEQVGKRLNITKERVRQIEARAMDKVRISAALCRLPLREADSGRLTVDPSMDLGQVDANPDRILAGMQILKAMNIAGSTPEPSVPSRTKQRRPTTMTMGELKGSCSSELEQHVSDAAELLVNAGYLEKAADHLPVFRRIK